MGAQCSIDDVYDVDFPLQDPSNESSWCVHPAVKKDDLNKYTVFTRPRNKEKDKVAEREGFKVSRIIHDFLSRTCTNESLLRYTL